MLSSLWYTPTRKGKKMYTPTKDFIAKVKQAIEGGVIVGDGHSIYAPAFYAPYFTEVELNEANLIDEHTSDESDYKSTLFDGNGKKVAGIKGVYNLYFLEWLNGKLGTGKYSNKFGRGSQARDYVAFICEAVESATQS